MANLMYKVARRLRLYRERIRFEVVGLRLSRTEVDLELGLPKRVDSSWQSMLRAIVDGFSPLPMLPREAPSTAEAQIHVAGQSFPTSSDIDWHLDPVFGVQWPRQFVGAIADYRDGSDLVLLWHVNKMTFLLDLTNQPDGAGEDVYRHIDSWCRANAYRVGMNWRSPMEAGTRLVHWLTAMQRVGPDSIPGEAASERIVRSLVDQARFVAAATERAAVPNNHLIGEAATLFAITVFCNSFSASKSWRELAETTLLAEATRQILDDGFQFENSINYHIYVLDFLLLYFRAKAVGDDEPAPELMDAAVRLAETLCRVVSPTGRLPQVGDDSISEFFTLRDRARPEIAGTRVRFSDFLKPSLCQSFRDTSWALRLLDVEAPIELFHGFHDAGIAVLRDENAHLLLTCGPQHERDYSHGHLHNDVGGIDLEVSGQPLFVDTGTWLYTRDDVARRYFKGARAHNVILVDGVDAMRSRHTFAWENVETGTLGLPVRLDTNAAFATCTVNLHGRDDSRFRHQRLASLLPEGAVFVDRLEPLASAEGHQFEALFHSPIGWKPDDVVENGWLANDVSSKVTFAANQQIAVARHEGEEARYSTEYGVIQEGSLLIVSGEVNTPTMVTTIVSSLTTHVEFGENEILIRLGDVALRVECGEQLTIMKSDG